MTGSAIEPTLAYKALRILVFCGGFYGVFAIVLFVLQGRIIFIPSPGMDRTPADYGLEYDNVVLPVQGFETQGWYVPLEHHRGVVLFSHGNAGNLAGRLESIQTLRSFGFSVLAYDYGGYGLSTGSPSESRCYADIRAMWDYLVKERGIPEKDILLFGRSLGAGPTAELAQSVKPGAVILESAFLSTPDVARRTLVFCPLTWLIRHRFENKRKVAAIASPLLIIHSPDDEVVPYAHGQRLFEFATAPKSFLKIRGGHNTGFVESEDVYRPGWEAFLTPIFGANPLAKTPAG